MLKSRVTINSPLVEISNDIAEKYLLRPFPRSTLPNGLLDYTHIRNEKAIRLIHGRQNADRVAVLIDVLFEFYKKHYDEFQNEFKWELYRYKDQPIKKIQIVGLMRATGRTHDDGSGTKFCQQGKIECLEYLKFLGVTNEQERNYLANAIVDSEAVKSGMSLPASLLADATIIETIPDR